MTDAQLELWLWRIHVAMIANHDNGKSGLVKLKEFVAEIQMQMLDSLETYEDD